MAGQRFLQTPFWAEFKGAHGWKPRYFQILPDGGLEPVQADSGWNGGMLTVLTRALPPAAIRHTLAYIPMAPEYGAADGGMEDYFRRLQAIADGLRPHLPRGTIFVRFDPPVDFASLEEQEKARRLPEQMAAGGRLRLRKSGVDIQPPDTVLLALDADEDALLAAMKSKWRYNIRLAAKKGVEVSRHYAGDADFEEAFSHFYDLFQQTSERDGVSFHSRGYYHDLLLRGAPESCAEARQPGELPPQGRNGRPLVTLYLARHEGDYLAGIITLFCPREAVYLYGASGNAKRNYMPAYLLQWTAIRDAKAYGCPVYDFYGMPPTGDEGHPMHGLYLFKTGFGGAIIHRPGSFDVPLRPAAYRLYLAVERARAWWFKKAVKKLRRR